MTPPPPKGFLSNLKDLVQLFNTDGEHLNISKYTDVFLTQFQFKHTHSTHASNQSQIATSATFLRWKDRSDLAEQLEVNFASLAENAEHQEMNSIVWFLLSLQDLENVPPV
jgi:hypothetical protein